MTVNPSRSRRARSPTNLAELIQSPSPSSKYQHQWQTSGTVGTTLSKSTVALHLIWPRIHISLRHVVFETLAQRLRRLLARIRGDSAWVLAAAAARNAGNAASTSSSIQPASAPRGAASSHRAGQHHHPAPGDTARSAHRRPLVPSRLCHAVSAFRLAIKSCGMKMICAPVAAVVDAAAESFPQTYLSIYPDTLPQLGPYKRTGTTEIASNNLQAAPSGTGVRLSLC